MPLYSIPRRSFSVPHTELTPINWRRGMFRIWIWISVAWIMGWIIHLLIYGLQNGFGDRGEFLVIPILLFGPPGALLLFGIAAGWAFRGFNADQDAPKSPRTFGLE